jgi:hypothetical protein
MDHLPLAGLPPSQGGRGRAREEEGRLSSWATAQLQGRTWYGAAPTPRVAGHATVCWPLGVRWGCVRGNTRGDRLLEAVCKDRWRCKQGRCCSNTNR